MTETLKRPSIDGFISLFLAALVLRGKTTIYVRRERWYEECRRMHALYDFMCKTFDALPEDTDKDRIHFLVRLRNHLGPGNTSSFEELLHSIRGKMLTIINLNFPHCEWYSIELGSAGAKSRLEQADPEMRELAEDAADAYMAPLREAA